MICESCEYCHSGIISYLDFNNINTDLGTRIIQCLKQLDNVRDHYNERGFKGINGTIGIIKEFDYDGKYNEFVKYTIEKIETPKWCPIK
jgi:hypothetical protein